MIFRQLHHRRPFFLYREQFRIFRAAEFLDGADRAFRFAGEANKSAEIDKRGVVKARGALWDKRGCVLPQRFPAGRVIDRFAKVEKPSQNASRVSFENRHRLIKRKAGDRVRGVFSNSGELLHSIDRSRKVPSASIYNGPSGGVKISRTSVIAETLPCAEHVIFRSAGQYGKIGKSAQPLAVIGYHGGNLGLLKHELGDEDGVGVARASPREIAAVEAIPMYQCSSEPGFWKRHR